MCVSDGVSDGVLGLVVIAGRLCSLLRSEPRREGERLVGRMQNEPPMRHSSCHPTVPMVARSAIPTGAHRHSPASAARFACSSHLVAGSNCAHLPRTSLRLCL